MHYRTGWAAQSIIGVRRASDRKDLAVWTAISESPVPALTPAARRAIFVSRDRMELPGAYCDNSTGHIWVPEGRPARRELHQGGRCAVRRGAVAELPVGV